MVSSVCVCVRTSFARSGRSAYPVFSKRRFCVNATSAATNVLKVPCMTNDAKWLSNIMRMPSNAMLIKLAGVRTGRGRGKA